LVKNALSLERRVDERKKRLDRSEILLRGWTTSACERRSIAGIDGWIRIRIPRNAWSRSGARDDGGVVESGRCMQTSRTPLLANLGIPFLEDVHKMLTILVDRKHFGTIGCRREKPRVLFPHRFDGEALEEAEKRLQILEPNVGHSSGIGGPQSLNLVTVQNAKKTSKTAADKGLIKVGVAEALSDIQASEPSEHERSERFHLEARKTRDWQEGWGGCVRSKG
jgi:hypothetical protein